MKVVVNTSPLVVLDRIEQLEILPKLFGHVIRNTRVVDIVEAFQEYGAEVTVCDPWANPSEVQHEYGISLTSDLSSLTSGGSAAGRQQLQKTAGRRISKVR